MASYREIVTKAVVGKGRKKTTTTHTISKDISPTTILGCWVINHNYSGVKNDNVVEVTGSYDVNIWYSSENNTKTEVVSEKVDYNEKINVKMSDDYEGSEEIIIRPIEQPKCTKAEITDGKVSYTIEKELAAEVVGDAKIRVGINEEEEWEDELNKEEDKVEQEINNQVNENFL